MLKEFRDFISRGNVIDLAVAVILGTAFTAIINSLVNDIFIPLIGALMGGISFESLAIQVGEASITYGNFIAAVVNFLLVALLLFLVIRSINSMQDKFSNKQEEVAPQPEPSEEVKLLTEIRDLLEKGD